MSVWFGEDHLPQAAQLIEIARVGPFVHHADQREHRRRRQAVREHLQHRAVRGHDSILVVCGVASCSGGRRYAQHHKAHVIDR